MKTQKEIKENVLKGIDIKNVRKDFYFTGNKGIFQINIIGKGTMGVYFQIDNSKGINLYESKFFQTKKDFEKKLFLEIKKL